ncbi:DNA repair protein RadA [Pontibacter sp. G13]|uniref:DNA repair protein RadA n=1 Tax=Pontibacter sp. G13 TaxID=3074898 RepID=UPI00288B44A5|nr:DNA repair protein RadA [Pontibacter sp. G13]WNJ20411.1 DNA repair protein RadA [Pontibacter sp. G13]
MIRSPFHFRIRNLPYICGMAKIKTAFICQECGTQHIKWQGQCSGCQAWGSLVEEKLDPRMSGSKSSAKPGKSWTMKSAPKPLSEIETSQEIRHLTPDAEMNRVLGGGIVPGSVTLIGGEPGIGKSTLLLQLALQLAPLNILYVSGEESESQIKMRAGRIAYQNDNLLVATETLIERILDFMDELAPQVVVIDSIQTMYTEQIESAPGSVSQVRESTARLIRQAKDRGIPMFLVGHINKEGSIAGPKVLEHMVDTVLTFEGDQHNSYRIVRTNKNRFGSTMEIGIYEMMAQGLREVSNPSEIFLSASDEQFSGVCISATMEGMRPLLVEIQALVSPMAYGNAQRSATGFDLRRLNMLLAVLEKRCGFKLGVQDVFINITGGLKVEDPAVDLALICAVISSLHDLPVDPATAFAAEVGLSGEIRSISRLEPRIAEAAKLGFKTIFVAKSQVASLGKVSADIEVVGVGKLEEVFRRVFGGE